MRKAAAGGASTPKAGFALSLLLLLLSCAAATATAAAAARAAAPHLPPECPEPHRRLLKEYKKFHDTNKHSPDAQYIVQTCWSRHCAGTGDRLRSTLYMLRVAIKYRKIFIVDWTNPAPLPYFLEPNQIDWTLTGFPKGFFSSKQTMPLDEFKAAVNDSTGKSPASVKFRAMQKYVTQYAGIFENNSSALTPIHPTHAVEIGACYFQFLFRFNATIAQRGEEHLRPLYGPKSVDYIAWHWWARATDVLQGMPCGQANYYLWRHMDADTTKEIQLRVSHLSSALTCAQTLARGVGVNLEERPVLLVTDFNAFRQLVAHGELRSLTTPNITAKHIDLTNSTSLALFEDVFVDLYVMSRARCLMTSSSGFSKMALWAAASRGLLSCHRDHQHCNSTAVQGILHRRQWRRLQAALPSGII